MLSLLFNLMKTSSTSPGGPTHENPQYRITTPAWALALLGDFRVYILPSDSTPFITFHGDFKVLASSSLDRKIAISRDPLIPAASPLEGIYYTNISLEHRHFRPIRQRFRQDRLVGRRTKTLNNARPPAPRPSPSWGIFRYAYTL